MRYNRQVRSETYAAAIKSIIPAPGKFIKSKNMEINPRTLAALFPYTVAHMYTKTLNIKDRDYMSLVNHYHLPVTNESRNGLLLDMGYVYNKTATYSGIGLLVENIPDLQQTHCPHIGYGKLDQLVKYHKRMQHMTLHPSIPFANTRLWSDDIYWQPTVSLGNVYDTAHVIPSMSYLHVLTPAMNWDVKLPQKRNMIRPTRPDYFLNDIMGRRSYSIKEKKITKSFPDVGFIVRGDKYPTITKNKPEYIGEVDSFVYTDKDTYAIGYAGKVRWHQDAIHAEYSETIICNLDILSLSIFYNFSTGFENDPLFTGSGADAHGLDRDPIHNIYELRIDLKTNTVKALRRDDVDIDDEELTHIQHLTDGIITPEVRPDGVIIKHLDESLTGFVPESFSMFTEIVNVKSPNGDLVFKFDKDSNQYRLQ
ncbi:ODV-E66 [Crangon crangon nudivirus]|uniref:ODV-E66 n=1 Tax=Crangon crangon nudivirus TaxID=2880838 RepID=A0AAE9BZP6_9VIRU|nr:ODV-E66 [Crangon crangon nudivirus]UBZ25507.1 ODV-E66 [Crangon crangon nudivirus]